PAGGALAAIGRFEGRIRTMAWYRGELWLAGDFLMRDTGIAGLAVWDGSQWHDAPQGAVNGPVYALYADGDSLMVGGGYSTIGGIAADSIAAWDGETWTDYSLGLWGEVTSFRAVYALARVADGTLYAGGSFAADGDFPTPGGLARYADGHWQVFGGGVAASAYSSGLVSDLAVHDGELYAIGNFMSVNGFPGADGVVPAKYLAHWDGQRWAAPYDGSGLAMASSWVIYDFGNEGPDKLWNAQRYLRLLSDGGRLYIGSADSGLAGVPSQSMVVLENGVLKAQGEAGLGLSGSADRLKAGGPDCALYAYGALSHAGGKATPARLARFADGAWTPLGPAFPDGLDCGADFAIDADGAVYVACSERDTDPAGHVLRLSGGQWIAVGEPFPQVQPQALAFDPGGRLWVAGGFDLGYVARLDGERFTIVEDAVNAPVRLLDFQRGGDPQKPKFVIGGDFTRIGQRNYARIAEWDGEGWQALGGGLTTLPEAIEFGAGSIFAATRSVVMTRTILGEWDGTAWTELGNSAHGLPDAAGTSTGTTVHTFYALREVGRQLIAAGAVWPESGGRNVFVYDYATRRFSAIGGGASATTVSGLAVTRDGLWFGGSIAEVGSDDALMPSVGIARYGWGPAP
ncbi:MAG: hypothetical protein ACREVL_12010, partial [Solimonas sp.]